MMAGEKSQAWLNEYRATIGGSKAGVVCGVSPWESRYDYFERRVGRRPWPEFDPSNREARLGTQLEALGLKLASEAIDEAVFPQPQEKFIYNDDYPWAHALPDGWTEHKPVEIKWIHPSKFSKLRLHGLPSDYVAQGLHNIAVTGADRLLFAVGCRATGQQIISWLKRDDETIGDLMRLEREFHEALATGLNPYGIPPAPIVETYEGGPCVTLHDEVTREAALALLEAKEMEDEAHEIVKDAKTRLMDHMGEAAIAEIPGILRFYNKMSPGRQTLNVKKAIERHPDLQDIVVTGDQFQTFRTYDLRKGKR